MTDHSPHLHRRGDRIYFLLYSGSLLCIGALFGSLSAVFLMDAVGRKASLLAFSVMSLFIGWTLLMAASQAWQLYVGRFLLGLGAGLEISISPVYIHETSRANMRDICGSFPQVMTALGIVICYFMGRSLAWNWLSLAALIFLIPFVFGLYYIPESPPWLVYNEEEDLAFRSMSQIRYLILESYSTETVIGGFISIRNINCIFLEKEILIICILTWEFLRIVILFSNHLMLRMC